LGIFVEDSLDNVGGVKASVPHEEFGDVGVAGLASEVLVALNAKVGLEVGHEGVHIHARVNLHNKVDWLVVEEGSAFDPREDGASCLCEGYLLVGVERTYHGASFASLFACHSEQSTVANVGKVERSVGEDDRAGKVVVGKVAGA
jgi:hypothetical protein